MNTRESMRLDLIRVKDLCQVLNLDQCLCHHAHLLVYSRRILSVLSHRLMSDRMTVSPSPRPSSTSMLFTEALPTFTGILTAVLPSELSLNSEIVLFSLPKAGRPTLSTFVIRSRSIVPSTLRSGRAPSGRLPSSSTSTVTVPFTTAGSIRITLPEITPLC